MKPGFEPKSFCQVGVFKNGGRLTFQVKTGAGGSVDRSAGDMRRIGR